MSVSPSVHAAEPTPRAEIRRGSRKPTGTLSGDNTDAGAEASSSSNLARHHRQDEHPFDKPHELDKIDRTPATSTTSRRASGERDGDGDGDDDGESNEKITISFSRDDPANPYNWGFGKKIYVTVTCMVLVMNSTIGSALPSGAIRQIADHFHVTNQSLLVLPVSIYLIGYVLGPLVFAPMSESYGRKWIVVATFALFTVFQLGCALAPTYSSLIVMRLLVGIGASTPVSVIGGIYADIYSTPRARGRAVTVFMAATTWGPLAGPIISGFVAPVSWRWAFWSGLIIAGATWPFVLCLPETYGPVVLKRKAERLRKETGNANLAAPVELEPEQSWQEFITVVLTRPVRMFLFEWIVLFSCLYLSVAYAIFYIFIQAYPIIFGGVYGFTAGQTGLTFLPIGVGSIFAGAIYLSWESYLEKAKARSPPPSWSEKEEYVRLPIALLGAPLFAISLFWLGWTARPEIHWIVPTLSALPFGVGFLLIFMALINYIVDAYDIYAASAMGAASCSRSIFGVVLPFAARPMYAALGVPWACSLLGLVSILMGVVPFVFLKYGEQIRANSAWCRELKQKRGEEEEKQRRREASGSDWGYGGGCDVEKQVHEGR